jgi:hypothetical protein
MVGAALSIISDYATGAASDGPPPPPTDVPSTLAVIKDTDDTVQGIRLVYEQGIAQGTINGEAPYAIEALEFAEQWSTVRDNFRALLSQAAASPDPAAFLSNVGESYAHIAESCHGYDAEAVEFAKHLTDGSVTKYGGGASTPPVNPPTTLPKTGPVPPGWVVMKDAAVTPAMAAWAKDILNAPSTYPMGAIAQRSFTGVNVLAHVETHPSEPSIPHPHRGVTLYVPSKGSTVPQNGPPDSDDGGGGGFLVFAFLGILAALRYRG